MSISTRTYAPVVTPVYHTLPKEDTLFIIDAHARWSFLDYDDIERIESLTLEDFAADFSAVELPTEGRMSEDQMKDAVESFLDTLRER